MRRICATRFCFAWVVQQCWSGPESDHYNISSTPLELTLLIKTWLGIALTFSNNRSVVPTRHIDAPAVGDTEGPGLADRKSRHGAGLPHPPSPLNCSKIEWFWKMGTWRGCTEGSVMSFSHCHAPGAVGSCSSSGPNSNLYNISISGSPGGCSLVTTEPLADQDMSDMWHVWDWSSWDMRKAGTS